MMICSNSRSEKKSFIFSNLIPNVQKSSCQEKTKLKTIHIFAKLLFYEPKYPKGILIKRSERRECIKKIFQMPKAKHLEN